MPQLEVVGVVGIPLLLGTLRIAGHRHQREEVGWHNPQGVVADDFKLRVSRVDLGRNAVDPVAVVHLGPVVIASQAVLHAQGRCVWIVGVASVLAGAVGADEPIALLAQLDFVLVKFNVPQAETVVALVHGRATAHVESVNQLRALVLLVRLQPPVAAQTDLEVVGVVIHQVDFLVTRAVDRTQTTCIHAVVA